MSDYSYQLLGNPAQIRLLEILPSEDGTTRFSLITYALDQIPRYEAISYTWGKPDLDAEIRCDGMRLPITTSCAIMLRYLREPSHSRLVWVDQICINQKNTKERNHQVTLMTSIYSKAHQVIVWIGETTPDAQRCLELVSVFSKERAVAALAKHRSHQWELEDPVGLDLTEFLPDYGDITPWMDETGWTRKALKDILSRPYFLRVWILQEVSVARHVVLVCGECKLDIQKLFDLLSFLQGLTEGDMLYPWNAAFTLNIFREDYAEAGSLDAGDAFIRTREHQATDKRDKVFALRNLCKDLRDNTPPPDYDKSENEIFMEAAKACLVADGGRLSMLSYGSTLRNVPDLPSWCPDFGGPVALTGIAGHSSNLWKKSQSKHCPTIEGNRLFVRGKIIDSIASVTEQAKWQDNAPRLIQEYRTWKEWFEVLRTAKHSYRKEPMEWAFWRTIFVDSEEWLTPESARINEEAALYVEYVEALHKRFMANDTEEPKEVAGLPNWTLVRRNVEDARKYTRDKRACVTKMRFFGLVLPHSKVGDVVSYLAGASILHILRPVGKNKYTVVGPCYIHGLMNGEKYPWRGLGLSKLTLI